MTREVTEAVRGEVESARTHTEEALTEAEKLGPREVEMVKRAMQDVLGHPAGVFLGVTIEGPGPTAALQRFAPSGIWRLLALFHSLLAGQAGAAAARRRRHDSRDL